MINKVTPRKLNPSLDSRLRKKDEMLDAINVDIKSDNDGDSGDVGVLKPVKGMTKLDFQDISIPTAGEQIGRRVIGSVTDEKNDIIFYFLFSEINSEQGVYAYDPNGNLSDDDDNELIKPVYQSAYFNFPQNGFVKADVVYTTNHEVCNLYFTDNRNEPRRLDVKRARSFTLSSAGAPDEAIDIVDFITACPKTPIHPISFEFIYDADYQVSEFRNIPGFQFAYQCIYAGGEESAISTYSDIAVPPSYVQQGTITTPNLLAHNTCRLTIPKAVNGVDVYSFDIEKIRILGRIGNQGSWYTIDEVDTTGGNIIYDFRNDRVLTGVPDEDVQKQFTSLPRKAQAQTVVDNRLFYGNYVEGFDEPEVSANMTVYYRDRPTDFLSLQLSLEEIVLSNPSTSSYDLTGLVTDGSVTSNRVAGYKMDTSQMPDSISAGSVVTVNLTVHPDQHIRLYNTECEVGGSHHASYSLFARPDVNTASNIDQGPSMAEGAAHLSEAKLYFGNNSGVLSDMQWEPESPEILGEGLNQVEVVCGTSASNPLSIQGRQMIFSCTVEFVQDVAAGAKEVLRDVICNALTGGDTDAPTVGTTVNVIQQSTQSSYSYNIGLNDEDGVDVIPVLSGDDFRKNLINAVGVKAAVESTDGVNPCGFFIINSADVSFSLNRDIGPQSVEGEAENGFLYLSLDSISNVSTKNCIPIIKPPSGSTFQAANFYEPGIEKWLVYSNSYASQNVLTDLMTGENGYDFIDGQIFPYYTPDADNAWPPTYSQPIFGSLSSFGSLESNISILDGEQGPNAHVPIDFGGQVLNAGTEVQEVYYFPMWGNAYSGTVNITNLFGIQVYGLFSILGTSYLDSAGNVLPVVQSVFSDVDGIPEDEISVYVEQPEQYDINFKSIATISEENKKSPSIEVIDFNNYLTDAGLINYDRSFKTEASHDFGVVYYDERGRAGNVNRLPSVYVPGYSAEERGSVKGRVEIGVQLNYQPPEWAHHYQIVYAGNSSISDFIQYTTGGAFVPYVSDDDESESRNIYVSLNYLQQHPTVSYAKDFGAVSTEGSSDIYTFKQGDRLRILSYYTNDSERIWPRDYEFDIVDSVVLTSDVDTNPLVTPDDISTDSEAPAYKTGRFLILKNATNAVGFTYQDVASQVGVDTNSHNWNDRCVVEIYSPLDKQSAEDRVYYEIGKTYNVIDFSGVGRFHQSNPILLRNGDVWWRRVPVNMPDYVNAGTYFKNLITSDTSPSKFRDYYLESNTFNDTVANANQYGWGKIKTISPINKEIRRDGSITYSDKNNYASQLVRFTSFNPSKLQYKDLPAEHGAINYILNHSDSVFCIQEEKTSALPVDRTILSDASGVESLIASSKVLGTQKFYAGAYGCDDNPESVVKVDNFVYFANKSRQQVYRFSPETGVSVISGAGMKQYFRYLFNRVLGAQTNDLGVRIVGGYDPLKDEFLISIMNAAVLTEPTAFFYEPPVSNEAINEVEESTGAVAITEDVPEFEATFNDFTVTPVGATGIVVAGVVSIQNIASLDVQSVSILALPFPSTTPITGNESNLELGLAYVTAFSGTGVGLYSEPLIQEDGEVFINTDTAYTQQLEPETEYNIVLAVFDQTGINLGSEVINYTTPSADETFEEALPVYDTTDLQYDTVPGFNSTTPIGYTVTVNSFSNQPGYSNSVYLVRNVVGADDIVFGNQADIPPPTPGDPDQALASIALFNDSAVQAFTNLEANEIQTLSHDFIDDIDVAEPHVIISVIYHNGFIQDIEFASIPAFADVSFSPTPLSIIATEGLSAEDAGTISGLSSNGLTTAIQSILSNPVLANQLTASQQVAANSFNAEVDGDLNFDDIIGTADLLLILAGYGGSVQPIFDLGSQGVEGFEVFNRDDEERLLIEPGSPLLDDLE